MAVLKTSLPFSDYQEWKDALRSHYLAITGLLKGKSNNTGSGTLTAGTTTTVTEVLTTQSSHITLTPLSSAAATALASAYISARSHGVSFTITHGVAVGGEAFSYAVEG